MKPIELTRRQEKQLFKRIDKAIRQGKNRINIHSLKIDSKYWIDIDEYIEGHYQGLSFGTNARHLYLEEVAWNTNIYWEYKLNIYVPKKYWALQIPEVDKLNWYLENICLTRKVEEDNKNRIYILKMEDIRDYKGVYEKMIEYSNAKINIKEPLVWEVDF